LDGLWRFLTLWRETVQSLRHAPDKGAVPSLSFARGLCDRMARVNQLFRLGEQWGDSSLLRQVPNLRTSTYRIAVEYQIDWRRSGELRSQESKIIVGACCPSRNIAHWDMQLNVLQLTPVCSLRSARSDHHHWRFDPRRSDRGQGDERRFRIPLTAIGTWSAPRPAT
jgi:hypothetical protein